MKQNLAAGEAAPPPVTEASESGPPAGETPGNESPERQEPVVRVTDPVSLLAVVPHLLTFQPSDSLVVIGTAPPRGQVRLTLRYDLPDPAGPDIAAEIARHAAGVLGAQGIETAAAVGYGPGPRVTPVADALRECAAEAGLRITELLRAENQRYWSYLCTNPGCCPAEGTPYPADDPAAGALAAAGRPVLASREELAATLAPVTGADAELMRQSTRRAEEHAVRLIDRTMRTGRRGAARRLIAVTGVDAVAEAIAASQRGETVPAGPAAAWLTVVLQDLRVRDDAWCRMEPEHRTEHLRLWTGLTRLAQPGYVAAPASLLAFVAWQSGNGALANVALDRALSDNPRYTMAQLLRQAIDSGAPPSLARIPMTPEEVAASYEEAWNEAEGDDDARDDGACG